MFHRISKFNLWHWSNGTFNLEPEHSAQVPPTQALRGPFLQYVRISFALRSPELGTILYGLTSAE